MRPTRRPRYLPTMRARRRFSGDSKKCPTSPDPDGVASTVIDAALGAWKMRRTPKGEASLLSKLRRFMPAGPVDSGLRKTFGLS